MNPDIPPAGGARVARIITRLNIGGPSIQATRLSTELTAHGYATLLLHGRLGAGEGDMRYLLPPDANVAYIPSLQRPLAPLSDLRALWVLVGELRRWRPQIVHTHMAKAGMVGRLAALLYNLMRGSAPRARVVHTYHGHVLEGYFGPVATALFVYLERVLAFATDAIVAISPAIRDELAERHRIGRESQYHVVPLGFDLAPFAAVDDVARVEARRALGVPPGVPVISTVGRLTAIKQHHLFLETVKRVSTTRPGVIALVAGDGELRAELEARGAALGLRHSVRWLGWRRDLATIYAATDVFLLTSRNEGTPVALIEAMATGVPGVSTDVGGVKDVMGPDDTGRLVPFGDAAALARSIDELLAQPDLRRDMGGRARRRVLEHYDIARLVRDIAALYDSLLDAR